MTKKPWAWALVEKETDKVLVLAATDTLAIFPTKAAAKQAKVFNPEVESRVAKIQMTYL